MSGFLQNLSLQDAESKDFPEFKHNERYNIEVSKTELKWGSLKNPLTGDVVNGEPTPDESKDFCALLLFIRNINGGESGIWQFTLQGVGAKKDQAEEIGKSQLKTFLTVAGHENPNKPGEHDIAGLKCNVKVTVAKVGEREYRNFSNPQKLATGDASNSDDFDDDIPF